REQTFQYLCHSVVHGLCLQKEQNTFIVCAYVKAGGAVVDVIRRNPACKKTLEKVCFVIFFLVSCAQTADLSESLFCLLGRICRHIKSDACDASQFLKRFLQFL